MNNLAEVAQTLTSLHQWNKFDWGATVGSNEWAWRYLVGCIAVGGTNEAAVLAMSTDLFRRYPTLESMRDAYAGPVADIMASHGVQYAPPKARHIVAAAAIIANKHGGKVPSNRKDLEALPGVGRHVASVILATVFGKNEFAVDLHVRRIMERMGYVGSDLALENMVKKEVPASLLGHFSRAFVDFGQARCGYTPDCRDCPVKSCASRDAVRTVKVELSASDKLEGYDITATKFGHVFQKPGTDKTCTVNLKGICSCNGFRFRRTCKHAEYVNGR